MTASRPDNEAIFHAARALPDPDRRREYVREACGGDEARIAHVEALLAAADGTDSLLDRPAASRPVATIDLPAMESPGTVIGPYKLIEQIGEGGMGTVWMAQQTEPVKRLVAVKLIKAGMDSKQVIARFEAERQALALMDHPNIARVLDGGATKGEPGGVSAGRPYFVMDLVKGVPITRYCDEHHLTPRQRLELFIPVCQAIQHAHQKGIIHRDLKPSNVLVALYDGKPVPKVIDFGVAKAAGQPLTDKTLVTGFGAIVGTLEYMSPEQAETNQLDIDTRSDIYALGVLLYELLAGSPPFSRKELEKAGMVEMLRVIREQEPSKPSTKLSTADGLPTLAANRGMEPAKLTKLVRGELDWIVMKALEKDRSRRYETANGFALDVQRYLADEPVLACPPSAGYRLRKLVRRHRVPVVAAGLVLLMLVVGIAGTTLGLLRAEHQWQLAEAKKQEAMDERDAKDAALHAEQQARADETKARQQAFAALQAEQQARADETKARQQAFAALQAEQQARADETKARQQAFAALRSMTADVVEKKFAQGTVLTEDDRAFLRGIIAQFDAFAAIKGDDAESRALRAEGRWRVGNVRRTLGELKEAEQDYDQALMILEQLAAEFPSRPEYREMLAGTHNNRGVLLHETGRPKEAEKDFDQAISIRKQLADDFPSRPELRHHLASSYSNRGNLLLRNGPLLEAEKNYDLALSIEKQLAADFPSRPEFREQLAKIYNNRGNLQRAKGRLPEAELDYNQALSIRKQLAADFPARPDFRLDLASSHYNRAFVLSATGRRKDAEKDYDEALSIYKQLAANFPARPEYHQELARGHQSRAMLLSAMGRSKDAEKDYDQAVSIFKELAAGFPSRLEFRQGLVASHMSRGFLLSKMGRLPESEKDYDQALSIQKQAATDFPDQLDRLNDLANTYVNLAFLQARRGDWAAAKRLLLEGRPHHLAALKADSRHTIYRETYRKHLQLLTRAHAWLLEQEDAVRTAETARDVGWDAPADAYDAACTLCWCIPIGAKHDKLDDQQRKETAQFYGAAAMKLLREAVSKGYKDVAHMKKDINLDSLRQREDFQKLIAELELKEKK